MLGGVGSGVVGVLLGGVGKGAVMGMIECVVIGGAKLGRVGGLQWGVVELCGVDGLSL